MTHDELVKRLEDYSVAPWSHPMPADHTLSHALIAVVELHKPWTSETGIWCRHCEDITDGSEPYPCPTIQAIEEQLK